MEPGPHGREESLGKLVDAAYEHAAMEPGPHGREEVPENRVHEVQALLPQWSPALTAGKRKRPGPQSSQPYVRRNGARPSRPGRGRVASR